KLHRKHLKWNEAETELQICKEKHADIQKHEVTHEHSFCRKCITVLKVSMMQQRGDLYFGMLISKIETTKDLEDVAGFYKDAEKLLKLSLWGNDVSCPKDESVKTTRNCAVIDPKGSSNHNGFLKGCWHCQRDVVVASKSLTMHLDLKWECLRRRLLIRVLKGLGKILIATYCFTWPAQYHQARGDTADERKVLFYSVSVMVSRGASKELNSSNLVSSMIDNRWTGDAYSIEQASVMHDIGCFFLKNKNVESNKSIKMASIVLGLKIAFLLSREVPALFQKFSSSYLKCKDSSIFMRLKHRLLYRYSNRAFK
nr:hypothetical protein [Tanacetum cinerariifolium]